MSEHTGLIRSYQILITAALTNTSGKMKGCRVRAADRCPFVHRHSKSQVTFFMGFPVAWLPNYCQMWWAISLWYSPGLTNFWICFGEFPLAHACDLLRSFYAFTEKLSIQLTSNLVTKISVWLSSTDQLSGLISGLIDFQLYSVEWRLWFAPTLDRHPAVDVYSPMPCWTSVSALRTVLKHHS